MAATDFLAQNPLQTGLKHLLISSATVAGVMALSLGAIQLFGDPTDAGPRAELEVPALPDPRAAVADVGTNGDQAGAEENTTRQEPTGLARFFGWSRATNGGFSPWQPGTPPPTAPDAAEVDTAAKAARGETSVPTVTSAAEAASAEPAPRVAGESARVLAPSFGAQSVENGVAVTRGGVAIGGAAPLVRAPVNGVHQQGPNGLLPRIAADGRTVFNAYRAPFTDTGQPKVSVVIGGLGLNSRVAQRAIDTLPAGVTLSFVPYAANLQGWINKARDAGHEVLIELPMEPFDYPQNDPGPHTLLAEAPADENARRLDYLLSRATGYFAVTNYLGGRFANAGEATATTMAALKNRGVGFLSDGSNAALGTAARASGLRSASAHRALDERATGADIRAQLGALEAQAQQGGAAIGFGVAQPITISQVADWVRTLDQKGLKLAPVSAMME